MLTYIILTYLLCTLGGSLYLLLRSRLSASHRKTAIITIVSASLLVPLFFIQDSTLPDLIPTPSHSHQAVVQNTYILEESVFIDFCPAGEVLEACYQQAVTSEQFCNCERIEKENLLIYEESSLYNILMWEETAFWQILSYCGLGIIFFLFLNILYLKYLVFRSQKEKREIGGKVYTILHPHKELAVASFRLFDRYIIWQSALNDLIPEEQDAVIWHEITHIRQFDTWFKIMFNLLQVLWLLNPIFYFLRRELDTLSEYIADEMAAVHMGNPRQYAELLFKIKKSQHLKLAHAFHRQSILKQRIQHLLELSSKKAHKSLIGWVTIPLIIFAFTFITQKSYPVIDLQIDKLKVYETLSEQSDKTGRNTFCRVCMQEQLEEACRE